MANDEELTTVTQSYFRLLSYKDEYEVARLLYTSGAFKRQLNEAFTGDYTLQFHLAPEIFTLFHSNEVPKKIKFGPWIYTGLSS